MNYSLTAVQAGAVADHIHAIYGDDDDLVIGMVEGETDAGEVLDALIEANAEDAAMVDAIKAREDDLAERRKRIARRIAARREGMMAILDTVGVKKWERPFATLSLRAIPPKRVVADAEALPDEFCTFTRKPNIAAIKDADDLPPGVTMDNGGTSLTVRTK